MVDYTILEYGVLGFLAYSSILMLIISTIREIPTGKSMSVARAVYMLFGVIAAFAIVGVGPVITLATPESTMTYVVNGSTGAFITNSTTITLEPPTVTLLNLPVWQTVHGMMGVILSFYVIQQFVYLFFKTDT